MGLTIAQARAQLAGGRTSSARLVGEAVARIEDAQGEGARAFIGGASASALAQAEAADRLAAAGIHGPLSGVPVSVKDLFDVQGEVTRAGSRVLERGPAAADGAVAARLRAAGAVLVGRTNMSEFAYTGLGVNPHYGTPSNPWDRQAKRIPGGSSSGAAVAVTDAMAVASVGTDTGGSCRIPAALCGLVGFKPTAGAIATEGMVPLSRSYDAVGTLAWSVACCALLDQVLRGAAPTPLPDVSLKGLRVGLPSNYMLDDLEPEVAEAYDAFKNQLAQAGAQLTEVKLESLAGLSELTRNGGIVAAEAYAWHRRLIETSRERYDPLILQRMEPGGLTTAADYLWLLERRAQLQQLYRAETRGFDVLAMPTVPIVAPRLADLAEEDAYYRANRLLLRNTSPANVFNTGAISLPCRRPAGSAPVGMMLMGRPGGDERLLAIAQAVSERI